MAVRIRTAGKATTNLAGKLSYSFALRSANVVLGMVGSIVVARIMGPEVLGMFSSALAISMLIGLIGNGGLGIAHMKIMASSANEGQCIASLFATKAIFVLVCAVALAAHMALTPLANDHLYYQILLVCSAVVLIQQCNFVIISVFGARIDVRKVEIPRFIGELAKHLSKIVVALLGLGALALGCAELAGALVVLVIVVVLAHNLHFSKPRLALVKQYLFLSVPLFYIQLSRGVVQYLDKAMIKYFYDSTSGNLEVGLYTAGQRLGTFVQVLMMVSSLIFFPAFSRLAAQGNFERIKTTIMGYESVTFCVFMPLIAALAAFSLPITLFLVGEEYRASVVIMQISIAGQFVMMLYQPYVNFLVGAKDAVMLTCMIFTVYIITNVILNGVFIPESVFGLHVLGLKGVGAAIATFIAYLVLGFQAKFASGKFMRIPTLVKYWRETVFLVALYVAFIFGLDKFGLESIGTAAFGGPLFVLLFWGFMFVFARHHLREAVMNMAKVHPKLAFISRRMGA